MTRSPPHGFKNHPIWAAFEVWADSHFVGEGPDDWGPWWDCFYAGAKIGEAEAG